MSKYELSISPDYCSNWTVVEGVRELFQNALDQEATVEDNKMFFDYDGKSLRIGNKQSILNVSTLLLGISTKRDDSNTIGKFGEGYKIATLVLLRLGKNVTFYNYGAKEVWKPRLVDSRRYKTKLLTFFVNKIITPSFIKALPDHNLTIVVDGVTPEEYEQIVESNLHLHEIPEEYMVTTPFGRILTGDRYKGKVYTNGLFICNYEYQCGYDFKPEHINIDRDRKLVSDFDLKWLSSRMWGAIKSPIIAKLAASNAADVAYIQHNMYSATEVYDTAYTAFKEKYGERAVPVINQDELNNINDKYKPVIVPESYKGLITSSTSYTAPEPKEKLPKCSPFVKRLEDWFDKARNNVPGDLVAQFESILDDMEQDYADRG